MNSPTHDIIAHRAHQLWQKIGQPEGRDEETWLIAERQLTAEAQEPEPELTGAAYAEHARLAALSEAKVESPLPPTLESKKSLQADRQKREARAPQSAHHSESKRQPAATGKPLWSKPHTS